MMFKLELIITEITEWDLLITNIGSTIILVLQEKCKGFIEQIYIYLAMKKKTNLTIDSPFICMNYL